MTKEVILPRKDLHSYYLLLHLLTSFQKAESIFFEKSYDSLGHCWIGHLEMVSSTAQLSNQGD